VTIPWNFTFLIILNIYYTFINLPKLRFRPILALQTILIAWRYSVTVSLLVVFFKFFSNLTPKFFSDHPRCQLFSHSSDLVEQKFVLNFCNPSNSVFLIPSLHRIQLQNGTKRWQIFLDDVKESSFFPKKRHVPAKVRTTFSSS
jgi:hypothetical protein